MSRLSPYETGLKENENSFKVESVNEGGAWRRKAVARCECGTIEFVGMATGMAPDIIRKKFGQKGWSFNHRGFAVCPECSTRRSRPALVASNTKPAPIVHAAIVPPPAHTPIAPPIATSAPIIEAPKETKPMNTQPAAAMLSPASMRRVFNLLEEHFDAKLGYYAEGWNDRRVSEQTGVAMVHVTRIRDEAFGPIKADPELVAMQEKVALLEKAITAATDDLVALQKRIEIYAAKMGVK